MIYYIKKVKIGRNYLKSLPGLSMSYEWPSGSSISDNAKNA